jgi:hypothetical protein
MKITKTKSTTETITYHLGKKITLIEKFVDDKLKDRRLQYVGKKHLEYELHPYYGVDWGVLKKTNPCWKSDDWFVNQLPEDPKDIDIDKILFCQWSSHSFFDINLEPVPVVISGDYIEAGIRSTRYDLTGLHKHFSNHPQVVSIGKIKEIPYYNNDSGYEKYFKLLVLPTVEQLKIIGITKQEIFYQPWQKHEDFLGMKPYRLIQQ